LTSNTHQTWNEIYENPYAVLNNLPSFGGPGKAQNNATPKVTAASLDGASSTKATATAVEVDVDDKKDVAVTLSFDRDDGTTTKTEEHGTELVFSSHLIESHLTDMDYVHSSSQPTVEFGDDLIWLGD
jgi:hypothetical protein